MVINIVYHQSYQHWPKYGVEHKWEVDLAHERLFFERLPLVVLPVGQDQLDLWVEVQGEEGQDQRAEVLRNEQSRDYPFEGIVVEVDRQEKD